MNKEENSYVEHVMKMGQVVPVHAPLKQRIQKALEHAREHRQLNDAMWPHLPFSLSIGEVLEAAKHGLEK